MAEKPETTAPGAICRNERPRAASNSPAVAPWAAKAAARRASARVLAARLSSPVCMNDSAAVAVEADDPALVPTRVGGRRVSGTTVPARDSSLADLIGPGEH